MRCTGGLEHRDRDEWGVRAEISPQFHYGGEEENPFGVASDWEQVDTYTYTPSTTECHLTASLAALADAKPGQTTDAPMTITGYDYQGVCSNK